MNKLTLAMLLGVSAALAGGCMDSRIDKVDVFATPAYSGSERGELIARSMEIDWKMMNDDIDSFFLLRPQSRLSIWNIR